MANFNAVTTYQGGVPLPDLSNIGPGMFVNGGPSAITNPSFAGIVVMPNGYGAGPNRAQPQFAQSYSDTCGSGTFQGQQASNTVNTGGPLGIFPILNAGKSSTQIALSRGTILR
jgi:hypothetical protein